MFKQEKSCQKWNDNTMPNIDDRGQHAASFLYCSQPARGHVYMLHNLMAVNDVFQNNNKLLRDFLTARYRSRGHCFPSLQKKNTTFPMPPS